MDDSFVQLLESLENEDDRFDRVRLSELSDLDAARLSRFSATWQRLGAEFRRSMLEQLGLLADSQIELSFESINRMAIADAASEVRVQAIENLWESEDPALVPLLLTALQGDSSDRVRSAAAKALGAFVLLGESDRLPAELRAAIERSLLQACEIDPSEEVRDRSLESLGYSSHAQVPALIESAFGSQSEARLCAALRAMARSASSSWSEHVLTRLFDPSPQLRLEAARAIGEIDARQSAADLVDLVDDVDDRVRRAAIWSLGQVGGSLAAKTLGKLVEEALDEAERAFVQDALDNMDFIESTRALLNADLDGNEGSVD